MPEEDDFYLFTILHDDQDQPEMKPMCDQPNQEMYRFDDQ